MQNERKNVPAWKRILFSATLAEKNGSHKIAYIAVMTAFVVVANMFFEFKLADTQFSLTLVVSALAGIVIGPLFGFVACFFGGFGRVFVPFRRVCLYAVDWAFVRLCGNAFGIYRQRTSVAEKGRVMDKACPCVRRYVFAVYGGD